MIDKNELAKTMGEDTHMKAKPIVAPQVAIDGNTGRFKKLCVGADGKYIKPKVDAGEVLEGVIIGVRMQLGEYNKVYSRTTAEYDSNADITSLWERDGKSGNSQKIMVGKPIELREKYNTLKSFRYLYMLVGSELVKVKVKGSAFTNLFAYFSELSEKGLHLFEVVTKIEPEQLVNESLGTDYFVPKFTIARQIPDEKLEEFVAPKLQELRGKFDAMKRVHEMPEAEDEEVRVSSLEQEFQQELPTIEVDDEEIRPEDLPF